MQKRFAEHLCPILNIHHPSVRFLFKISALPVGLPSTPDLGTWSARGRKMGGGVVKWEKAGGQGEKTLYEDSQEGERGWGGGLGSCMLTQTTWVKDQMEVVTLRVS